MISEHEKLTDSTRKLLIQKGDIPLPANPDLKKEEGKDSLRRGRENLEGAGKLLSPTSASGQTANKDFLMDWMREW